MIYAAYKDIIDLIVGVLAALAMLAALIVAGILAYQAITGDMPGDDTAYVCTMDDDRVRCEKETR